jgi:pimeloyl-ACP methyl ester carboxylesterase
LFIHGFGGNALSYPWVLRKVAHAHGYALVAPGYGAGLWYEDEAPGVIARTLEWMAGTGRFDMDRVVLAGLSNGGFGVTAVAGRHPWRGVAWLSGVMVPEDVAALDLKVPVLILHGGVDDRIPMDLIDESARALRSRGTTVDLDVVDDADHFLLFTHRERVDAALERWLSAIGG